MIQITIEAIIPGRIDKVWEYYTNPSHITKWNFPLEDWQCPHAENDVRTGGKFNIRMEAKDKTAGFDFEGTYDAVKINELLAYTIKDGRKVKVGFKSNGDTTSITLVFDSDSKNLEYEKTGWQSILNNFKKYVEAN